MSQRKVFAILLTLGLGSVMAAAQDNVQGSFKIPQIFKPKGAIPPGQPSGKYPVITVVRPPDFQLPGHTINIVPGPGVAFPGIQGLQMAFERTLQNDFTLEHSAKADSTFTYSVISYDPVKTRTYSQKESRNVQTGTTSCKQLFSKQPGTCPQYGQRDVPVEYWEATGTLVVTASVTNSHGELIASFTPERSLCVYSAKRIIAENGVSTLGGQSLPSAEMLAGQLGGQVVQAVARAFVKTNQPVEVRLSNEGALKNGNNLALAGHWTDALASWQSARVKKDGDRDYNMAVAKEVLAYQAYDQSRNPDDAAPLFAEAFKLYDQALLSDPGDSTFKSAQARIQESRANFERAKQQYITQQRNAEIAEIKAKERADQTATASRQDQSNADNQDEAEFRTLIRRRLTLGARADSVSQEKFAHTGETAYRLSGQDASRIVTQEVSRRDTLKSNLQTYKESFADLVADRTLDANDRAQLVDLMNRLQLTPTDVKPIEAQFSYRDTSTNNQPKPRPRLGTNATLANK